MVQVINFKPMSFKKTSIIVKVKPKCNQYVANDTPGIKTNLVANDILDIKTNHLHLAIHIMT